MGPACVKKAREKRMKEEKEKVSNVSFWLDVFLLLYPTFPSCHFMILVNSFLSIGDGGKGGGK